MKPGAPVWRDGLLDGCVVLVAGAGAGGEAGGACATRLRHGLLALGARVEAGDVADAGAAEALLAGVFERRGRLSSLVTIATELPALDEDPARFDPAAWRAGVDAALNGSWYLMHAAARQWRDRAQPGQVVAVIPPYRNDNGGPSGLARAVGASLAHLVKTVAVEWAEYRIRVNAVAPVQPDTQALVDAVVLLCADSGKFVTGEVMNLAATR